MFSYFHVLTSLLVRCNLLGHFLLQMYMIDVALSKKTV